jgi:hypothetical protein
MYAPAVPRHVAFVCLSLSSALACVGSDTKTEDASTSETESESGSDVEPGSLIDHTKWMALEAQDDPLADHRPETIDCGLAGWYLETSKLEVDTNFCNYLAVGQPSLASLEQGQTVQLILYHFDLVAPEPALAHLAILIDGQVLWEQEVAIPGDAFVWQEEFASPFSAELGSQVVFHLHNHGQNTWVLQDLIALP